MNKNDLKIIFFIIITAIMSIVLINLNDETGQIAHIYYMNKEVKTIDLSINNTYTVLGYNGEVKIEVKDRKIRVIEENSPLHLCSKQGYIFKSTETIICLPNKIVIKITDGNELDGVVG
ncbi:MAG: NusG domain II-containing protein [Bacilli bacterium]|nr:NusG domain II-containing protein [Bacilli bacterium]